MNRKLVLALLLLGFGGLVGLFAANLGKDPSVLPSTLLDQPAPTFSLPILGEEQSSFNPESLSGEIWLLNVWASWCIACRLEHEQLLSLQEQGVKIVGLNYKDIDAGALDWLQQWEDPYLLSVVDKDGRVGIDFGVYGVPETFMIDRQGAIRAKHTGPIMAADLPALMEQYRALQDL